jgi:predicted transposase/invertase (TIGR01784 family)
MSEINISPKIDYAFRKVFGSEGNTDILISLINSVVEPDLRLTEVAIKNPFILSDYLEHKTNILDIKAVDQDGKRYDIEMQVTPETAYGKRAVYYVSKLYTEQMVKGVEYESLNKAIGIHFLDFTYFNDNRIVRQLALRDVDTSELYGSTDNVRLYFVEMGKFRKDWPEIGTALDRWVAFLNKADRLNRKKLPAVLKQDPAIVKAAEELERIGLNPKEREIYEAEVKARMLSQSQLKSAREEGREEGGYAKLQQVVMRQITHRFGEVPGETINRLSRLSASELDDLSMDLLDFTSKTDVEKWLTRH